MIGSKNPGGRADAPKHPGETEAGHGAKHTCRSCGRTFESQKELQAHQAECGKSIPADAQVESDVSKIGYGNPPGAPETPEREWQGNRGQRDERPDHGR